jgi:hypothetical protein
MGNAPLLLFSSLVLCLALLYFWKKCPDLDLIDIYLVYIALHFGIYPFIRGLYSGKGVVYDTANHNPIAVGMVFLQIILIVIIMKVIYAYFPPEIKQYLKVKMLIEHCARVNNFLIFSIFGLLVLTQIIAYFKYGIKAHILPHEFNNIGKDLPYWLTSVMAVYNLIVLSVFIVLASKAAVSKDRSRYWWMTSVIILLPFGAYYGRKTFVNLIVLGAIVLLVTSEQKIFKFKYIKFAALMILSFFMMSDMYLTYRPQLQAVGSFGDLENPITAALNFNATLENLKGRPGTWEFDYLVFDRQMKGPGRVTTNGKVSLEGLKSAIPRIFWPGKKFRMTSEVLAEEYKANLDDVSLGSNMFGIAQSEIGYISIIVVPLTILAIMLMMAGLMKMTRNYPEFFWLFSVSILYYIIYIEENQSEIFSFLRNIIAIMTVFIFYLMINKKLVKLRPNRCTTKET